MKGIRATIAGVGNHASSLVQGLEYCKDRNDDAFAGLMRYKIGDWNRRKGIARSDLGGGRFDV